MRILITGGAGFIGSWTAELAVAHHQVLVVDDLSTGSSQQVPPGARLVCVDVRDRELLRVVSSFRPHGVIHLAAQVSAPASEQDPGEDASVNILGTINVLEACRKANVRCFVYASSAAVYGEPQRLPVEEDHPRQPRSPYGFSKLAGEWYCWRLTQRWGMNCVILRYANVYGPRQGVKGEGGVVAAFASRLARGLPGRLEGDGEQTRDFVYVQDVARANIMALQAPAGTYNIGGGRETSIRALHAIMAAMAGVVDRPERADPRPADIRRSVLCCRAAQERMGWRAEVTLEDGLRRTMDYWQARTAHDRRV